MRSAPCVSAGTPLDVSDQFVAGLGAGVAASMVACPTELIKCRLQAQSGAAPAASAGSPGVSSSLILASAPNFEGNDYCITAN